MCTEKDSERSRQTLYQSEMASWNMCPGIYIFTLPTVSSVPYLSSHYQLCRIRCLFFGTLKRRTLISFLEHSGARSSTQSGTNTPIDRSYTVHGVYIAHVLKEREEMVKKKRQEEKKKGRMEEKKEGKMR